MAPRPLPPIGVLRQFLIYEPETGRFWWRSRTPDDFPGDKGKSPEWLCRIWNARYAGAEAFTAENGTGYKASKIFAQRILAHRVAWKMVTGEEPPVQIDHIDGRRDNNAFSNLRASSDRLNSKNRGLRADNSSGVVGVHFHIGKQKWTSSIGAGGKQIPLGTFATKEDAIAARRAAEIKYGFFEAHGKKRSKRYGAT